MIRERLVNKADELTFTLFHDEIELILNGVNEFSLLSGFFVEKIVMVDGFGGKVFLVLSVVDLVESIHLLCSLRAVEKDVMIN